METTMTAADIAYKAAEIASERGHCKNIEEDGEGHVCFIGAVNLAAFGVSLRPDFHDRMIRIRVEEILRTAGAILRKRGRDAGPVSFWSSVSFMNAIFWNNQDSTTGEDVVLLLKETAVELEGR